MGIKREERKASQGQMMNKTFCSLDQYSSKGGAWGTLPRALTWVARGGGKGN